MKLADLKPGDCFRILSGALAGEAYYWGAFTNRVNDLPRGWSFCGNPVSSFALAYDVEPLEDYREFPIPTLKLLRRKDLVIGDAFRYVGEWASYGYYLVCEEHVPRLAQIEGFQLPGNWGRAQLNVARVAESYRVELLEHPSTHPTPTPKAIQWREPRAPLVGGPIPVADLRAAVKSPAWPTPPRRESDAELEAQQDRHIVGIVEARLRGRDTDPKPIRFPNGQTQAILRGRGMTPAERACWSRELRRRVEASKEAERSRVVVQGEYEDWE